MKKKLLIAIAILFFIVDAMLVWYKFFYKHEHRRVVKPIHKVKNHYKYSVYLTSDDGPLVGTKYLDQLIRDYEVPFTVFLVGKPVSTDRELEPNLERYKNNRYVLIGNHSFTHANFHYRRFYSNPDGVEEDFMKNEKFLNISSKLARLPGRNVFVIGDAIKGDDPHATEAAKLVAKNDNYKFFGWDYELHHYRSGLINQTDAQIHYKKIKELLKNGETFRKNQIIVLMHDQMFTSKVSQETLGELILLLQDDEEIKLKQLDKYKI